MSEEADKKPRDRSPAFPYISLKEAVDRVDQLHKSHQRHQARIKNLAPVWDFSAGSSSLLRNVAALKSFGLVDEIGSGEDRKVAVSDLGFKIVADKRAGVKEDAIRKAFENCTILSDHRKRWGKKRPPDDECLSELHIDLGFTEGAARKFISVYDDSVEYANIGVLDSTIKTPLPVDGTEVAKIDVGMFVQWEQAGLLKLPQAAKLVGFSADGVYAFVEGHATGIRRGELIKAEAPTGDERPAFQKPPVAAGGVTMVEATYPIKEGTCTLSWPSEISAQSAKRLKKWLELMLADVTETGGGADEHAETKEKQAE